MDIGQEFGWLTVKGSLGSKSVCRCKCGKEVVIKNYDLARGHNSSCGCKLRAVTIERNTTHGQSGTKAYRSWAAMKTRVTNPNADNYQFYGGRGIKVCERWLTSFENFYDDMGDCPEGKSLERIDVNGDYCKENCKWANHEEQMNNTSRNHFLTFSGETLSISQWARKQELNPVAIIQRLNRGWSVEKTLSTPLLNEANYDRKKLLFEFKGQKKTISEWAKDLRMPRGVLDQRLRRGPIEKALTEPYVSKLITGNIG